MATNWRQYSIFISSTFIDMDAERDIIKFRVMNKLNQRYYTHRINFQVIDLRAGINTEMLSEQQREEKILGVCFNCIDSARPFFIGLLGDRYGWIPSEDKRNTILRNLPQDKQILLQKCGDVSVTEMEILYGAIGDDGTHIDHSLFFYRTPESYQGMAEEKRRSFSDVADEDTAIELEHKKEKLHQQIKKVLVEHSSEDQWIDYTLTYQPDTQSFSGLDQFAELVYNRLVQIIDAEIGLEEPQQQIWWVREQNFARHIADKTTVYTVDRTALMPVEGHVHFISGENNSGKSVLLSQFYQVTQQEKHIAFVGLTPYSHALRPILLRWLCEMGEDIDERCITDTETLPDLEVFRKFRASAAKRGAVFFLDNLGALSEEEQMLGWLSDDLHFFITGSESQFRRLSEIHHFVHALPIAELSRSERDKMIDQYEIRNYFSLPQSIKNSLYREEVTAGEISLTMKLTTGLSAEDYKIIRNKGGQIEDINHYLTRLYNLSLTAECGQFRYVLNRFIGNVCHNSHFIKFLDYLAASRVGLRECDLAMVMGQQWDPVAFALITDNFSDYFISDPSTHRWIFQSPTLLEEILSQLTRRSVFIELALCLMQYDDTDCMKREMLIYYLIKAHCPEGGKEYLASKKHFNGYDEVSEWYHKPLSLLKYTYSFVDDVKACCEKMTDGEKVTFLTHLLDHGLQLHDLDFALYQRIVDTCALELSVEALDEQQVYALGLVYTQANSYAHYFGLPLKSHLSDRSPLIRKGLACFCRASELNPDNPKARNMKTVMVTELMDWYIDAGDYDKVTELYNRFGNLSM